MKKVIKKRQVYIRRRIIAFSMLLFILAGVVVLVAVCNKNSAAKEPITGGYIFPSSVASFKEPDVSQEAVAPSPVAVMTYPTSSEAVRTFSETDIGSKNAVLIDVSENKIIANLDGDKKIFPASLTKIMTLIVAVEKITDLDDTFVMTEEIVNEAVEEGASRAGFLPGEKVSLMDLLYGTILPSGADATMGIAEKLCGTEADFVKLMNDKVAELGLVNTHFMNSSGLHDENHYSTAVDMAMILQYALEDELCKKILSTYEYTSAPTEQHPEGILMTSSMFSKMYGNEAPGVAILGGKVGFTDEAGNCLASFAEKNDKTYIAVTTKGAGKYMPIFDAIKIYTNFLP